MRPVNDDEFLNNLPLRRDPDGTFVQDNRGHDIGCDDAAEECAQDDEPYSEGHHLPGTADDVPYLLSEDGAEPADLIGQAAKHLVEEDEREGVRLDPEQTGEADRILDALGDDAGEAIPHSPEGVSATGDTSLEEHGGFPTRE